MWITRASHSGHTMRVIRNSCSPAQVEDAVAAHRRLLWCLCCQDPTNATTTGVFAIDKVFSLIGYGI